MPWSGSISPLRCINSEFSITLEKLGRPINQVNLYVHNTFTRPAIIGQHILFCARTVESTIGVDAYLITVMTWIIQRTFVDICHYNYIKKCKGWEGLRVLKNFSTAEMIKTLLHPHDLWNVSAGYTFSISGGHYSFILTPLNLISFQELLSYGTILSDNHFTPLLCHLEAQLQNMDSQNISH